MGLSKEQLLLLDGLLYYSEVSDLAYGKQIKDIAERIYKKGIQKQPRLKIFLLWMMSL